jgi:dolichol-phosphate mannosyltransferase
MKLSIVIPCYNEEEGIYNLYKQLTVTEKKLSKKYKTELIFVDDGSTDKTYELLKKYFGKMKNAKIIRHKKNKNLGAALRTGFKQTTGDLIACLDSDCTYPPSLLFKMLSFMDKKTDIVAASPLHPEGKILNVPKYRIFLSRSIGLIYRILLWKKIYSFQGMVKLYRKKVIKTIKIKSDGFIGVTELMIYSLLKGYRVKECPTDLSVRKYGTSKIKLLNVIFSHLKMIFRIILIRIGITKIN